MKSILKNENSLIFKILLLIKGCIISLFIILLRIFPIKRNRIFVISYYGQGYGDNGKYIVDELLKNNKYEIYWTLSDLNDNVPIGVNKLKYKSLKYYYILATSKVWINNCRFPFWIKKRKNQFYIQVWHGNIALKKIEFDVEHKLGYRYIKSAKNDNKMIDCLISSSSFCTNVMYRGAFKSDKKIYELGIPRNDILVHSNKDVVNKVKKYFGLNKEKIVLYAPTFRKEYSNQYNIDFVNLIKILKNKDKNEWKVILRLHPNVRDKAIEYGIKFDKNVLDASFYDDMQELIVASDLIITDYSSVMFDGMIAKKPVLLYTTDADAYNDERGTYFSLDDLPFKKSNNNKELINVIENESFNNMMKDYDSFSEKIGFYLQGNASCEVVKIIDNIVCGESNEKNN